MRRPRCCMAPRRPRLRPRPRGKPSSSATHRETHAGIESHTHDVSVSRGTTRQPQRHQLLSPGDDALSKEKTGHEFLVVPRRAKRDAKGLPSRAHFQRFFSCQVVFDKDGFAVIALHDLREFDVAAFVYHEKKG